MVEILIGRERENVTIRARRLPRPDRDPDLAVFEASGSFSTGRLHGEFKSLLEPPDRFVEQLEQMNQTIKGEARWCGVDDDFDLQLKCKSLGVIDVKAKFHDFASFEATIRFEIDQSYLQPIISTLRSALAVRQ